ncbi:hypothetical protein ACIGHF_02705 [Stenotrophomonas sp. NPDC077464]|uniref:hypothetical protein n=1 Tax=unclassified Stenotrophomonas TaxID=196198 RepID=UPI0037D8698D
MKTLLVSVSLLASLASFAAQAQLPQLNATCPGNIELHVDQGGPAFINGREAVLKASNENYYEARDAKLGVTVSISRNPDGSTDVSYTGKNRANGVCRVVPAASAAPGAPPTAAAPRESHPGAEKACLAAVAAKTRVPAAKLTVNEALGAEAGILVKVRVPGADAPWSCMTDAKGKPWSVTYSGSEGAL